jgi:hypothetical protein
MSGRDEWVEKELAKEAKGKAKVQEMVSAETVAVLVHQLTVRAAEHAVLAERMTKVGWLDEFSLTALSASAGLHIAQDLIQAYGSGKPITLKARLETARSHLERNVWDIKRRKETEKTLVRKEKAAAKKAGV